MTVILNKYDWAEYANTITSPTSTFSHVRLQHAKHYNELYEKKDKYYLILMASTLNFDSLHSLQKNQFFCI